MPGSVYLRPGDWYFGERATVIETVLGSCVAVIARAPDGATFACHCMLPHWDGDPAAASSAKYVDRTVGEMLRLFGRRGISPGQLEVKLFGGAGVLVHNGQNRALRVGRDNVDTAVALLHEAGVQLAACQVGGRQGFKLSIDSVTGAVLVRRLRAAKPSEVKPSGVKL
jgi:chemotaxis protein CheD